MEKNHCNTCPTGTRGYCCWYSTYNGTVHVMTEPCPYLTKAGRCKIYKKRFEINPKCLTIEEALEQGALPEECEYVKRTSIIANKPYKKKLRDDKYGFKKGRLIENKNVSGHRILSDKTKFFR